MNLIDVNLDLERCERVIKENNYLEIIIAIEEIQDKYRGKIKNIGEESNNVVWNYSIKDLKNIKNYFNINCRISIFGNNTYCFFCSKK